MQHRTPQSRVPRPAHVQPLEGRRLMSVVPTIDPPIDPPMPFAPPGEFVMPAGPMRPAFDARLAMDQATPAVQVEAATAIPTTVASLGSSVVPTVTAPATPLAADLLSDGSGSVVATTAAPAVASLGDWAQPTLFATGGIALAPMPVVAVPAVSTALGEVIPTVDRTPFEADGATPAVASVNVASAMDADVITPTSADTAAVVPDLSVPDPAASVAAPSFGETVLASAGASHPLAIALAAAGATALWVSTESARDRRREALCRMIAEAVHDRQLVALGLFRG